MGTYTRLILSEREEISINAMQGKSIRSKICKYFSNTHFSYLLFYPTIHNAKYGITLNTSTIILRNIMPA